MKPDEWIEGIENEAKSVEDAKWVRETKYAAWRALWQQDASLLPGVRGQAFIKCVVVSLVSLPLVAFYGAVLEQMGWMSLLPATLFCAGSLVVVGGLAIACGRGHRPVWIVVGLTLLSVILLGQVFGSGHLASRSFVAENISLLVMGMVLLAAYAAYFYSLGRRWMSLSLI